MSTPYPPQEPFSGQDPYASPQQPTYGAPQQDSRGQPLYPGQQQYPGQPPYPGQAYGAYGMAGPMGNPAAPYGVHPVSGIPYSDKSKMAAGLLQLFAGGFGAGRFYTGHTGLAIAQLLTCGGLGIWALIDAIMMFSGSVTDVDGRPLRDS